MYNTTVSELSQRQTLNYCSKFLYKEALTSISVSTLISKQCWITVMKCNNIATSVENGCNRKVGSYNLLLMFYHTVGPKVSRPYIHLVIMSKFCHN